MFIINQIIKIIILIYLIIMGIIDIKTKHIPIIPGVVCLGVSITVELVVGTDIITVGTGVLVGGCLYAISRMSRGSIGEADALVYAITGSVLGVWRNMELLLISLFFAAVVGGVLMVVKHVGRKYRLPFVPFTMVAYGVVAWL